MASCLALPSIVATPNAEESSSVSLDVTFVIWSIWKVFRAVWDSGNVVNSLADLHLVVLEDASFLAAITLGPFVNTELAFTWDDDNENRFGKFLNTHWDVFPAAIFLFDLHDALVVGNAVISVDL